MPAVSLDVDVSSIQLAIDLAGKQTRGSMDKLLGYTAYYTAVRAQKYTPYTELSTIDAEMEVTVTPIISAGYKGKNNITSNKATPFALTRAQKIVLARMNPNSNYNLVTDSRWRIPYQKVSGIGGFYILEQLAERMIAARRSSTHFLQVGWKAVKNKIKAAGFRISEAGLGISDTGDDNTLNTLPSGEFGSVDQGGQGTAQQFITISNLVGMSGEYPNLDRERNAALQELGTPALQQAMDEQAQWMREKYFPRASDEIAEAWNSVPDAGEYARGFHIPEARMAEKMDIADFDMRSGAELEAFN